MIEEGIRSASLDQKSCLCPARTVFDALACMSAVGQSCTGACAMLLAFLSNHDLVAIDSAPTCLNMQACSIPLQIRRLEYLLPSMLVRTHCCWKGRIMAEFLKIPDVLRIS